MKPFFKPGPQEQVLNHIKQDINFYDTTDYHVIHKMLFNRYNEQQGAKSSRFALTPSQLHDNLGNKYIDIRVCGKFMNDDESFEIRIDDTAVMKVDSEGQISFHARENIEQGIYDKPLTHITTDKVLKAPLPISQKKPPFLLTPTV